MGIKVEFSKVSDGNMSFVWGDEADVIKNRQQFLERCGFELENSTIIFLEHGVKIYKIEEPIGNLIDKSRQEELIGDGLLTDKTGVVLMLVVADCIPAVLFDPAGKQMCVLHAGRKGIELNIISEAVKMMKPKDLASLELIAGPAISKESYVFDGIDGIDTTFWGSDFKLGVDNKYHMDIKNKFKKQAIELGLSENNINISSIDTFTEKEYFSHRRSMATGDPEGRFAIVASIL